MRMRRTVRNAWVQALRSGDYEQTTGALAKVVGTTDTGEPKTGYCCLGVLSEMALKSGVDMHVTDFEDDLGEPARAYEHEVNYPPTAVATWACPFDGGPVGGDSNWTVTVLDPEDELHREVTLADENDGGATFADIANLIENDLDADGDIRDDLVVWA